MPQDLAGGSFVDFIKLMTFHIALDDIEPRIWRVFEVDSFRTFDRFHNVIQAVMGWGNEHLYRFEEEGRPHIQWDFDREGIYRSPMNHSIDSVLSEPGQTIRYLYDFGDGWYHTLTLQSIEPLPNPETYTPRCIDGAGACPPEDSGGPYIYPDLLAALKQPDQKDLRQWVGEDFDPNALDIEAVSRRLKRCRSRL